MPNPPLTNVPLQERYPVVFEVEDDLIQAEMVNSSLVSSVVAFKSGQLNKVINTIKKICAVRISKHHR